MLSGQYKLDVEHAASRPHTALPTLYIAYAAHIPRAGSIDIDLSAVVCFRIARLLSSPMPFLFMPISLVGPTRRAKQLARRRRAPWIYVLHRKKS